MRRRRHGSRGPVRGQPELIRLARVDDATAIAAIYRPIVERTAISFEEVAPDEREMRARIAEKLPTYPWLVYDDADAPHDSRAVLGYAYAGRWRDRAAYRRSVEVTAYVDDSARGRGIGRALYEALFRILEMQGFRRAFAGVTLPNDASIALHRAVGFVAVGIFHEAGYKYGAWHDVEWYERAVGDTHATAVEPTPLAQLAPNAITDAIGSGPSGYVSASSPL